MTFQSWVQLPESNHRGRSGSMGIAVAQSLWVDTFSPGSVRHQLHQNRNPLPSPAPHSTQACAQQSSEQITLSTFFSSSALVKLFWFHAICIFCSKTGNLIVLKPTLSPAPGIKTPIFLILVTSTYGWAVSQNKASLLHKASGQFSSWTTWNWTGCAAFVLWVNQHHP